MLTRLSYGVYRRSSSVVYRFQRRFTRAGILVMCSALLAAGLGVDLDQSLAYQLFSLLFVLLLVALVSAAWFRGRFEIHRNVPRLASAGQELAYSVRVHNLTRKPQPGLLREIAARFHTSLRAVPIIGDSERDIEAARRVDARPMLVLTGSGCAALESLAGRGELEVYDDLSAVADRLLAERNGAT